MILFKKRSLLGLSLLLVLVFTIAAGAYVKIDGNPYQASLIKPVKKTLNFVFIPKTVHPWYEEVKDGVNYAIKEFEKQGIKINVTWDAPPTPDISSQISKFESHMARRPDGIAIACIDPPTNAQVINEAVKAGINVITFDNDSPESMRLAYVGHNKDYDDGFELGEYLAKKINYKGEVAVLTGTPTAPNHVGRTNGFLAAMKKYPDIKVVAQRADNDVLDKAVEIAEGILQAYPNIKGFFGCNASNPIGIARAVKDAGKAGKICIVGMDDLDETVQFMKEGVIDAVKVQRQWEQGYWSVKYLVALNEGHTIPKEHPTGSRIMTKADLK